jgi:DNA-binding transcriptional LysR family regulator
MALPEIRLMQAAIGLAEELSFSRASERLHISQPTLSKQIIELEGLLGFRLFERNHQNVELTDAGRAFVEEARDAVLHAERAVMSAKAIFNGADEILNIGKSSYIDPFLISTVLSVRLPLFPGMKTKLWSNYSHELAHQVVAGTLDLAIVTGIPETPKLSHLKLADNPYYVAMLADDPLASKREVRINEVDERNWIVSARHANPHLHDTLQIVASDSNAQPNDIFHVTTAEEASELIWEHKAVAFLSRTGAWRIARDGITMRPLVENRLRLVTTMAMRSDSKSRLVGEFVRATSRKLTSLQPAIQRPLPLTS